MPKSGFFMNLKKSVPLGDVKTNIPPVIHYQKSFKPTDNISSPLYKNSGGLVVGEDQPFPEKLTD
jgi:hypothetical protein